MLGKTTFKGANVFMSRNLVPPEIFDSLHDAVKQNGAEIFLCCDPSRNGPNDYHVISSCDHEKFNDLREKGCNLLGPQCVLSCAKEHRVLPRQGFTCCLAMDGVKILASGFDMEEKVEIAKLVTAMGGVLQTKVSSDVSFVIVKNVLAGKYKWALNNLKKPIVTRSWLQQCWKEHRVVPHESYRVLPFSGLTISLSRIPADERKEMEKLVIENGGKYSRDLTRKSTHLICEPFELDSSQLGVSSYPDVISAAKTSVQWCMWHIPEGDKYKVAKRWGHIHIVTRAWFNQSITKRACLNEESYSVQSSSVASMNTLRSSYKAQRNPEKVVQNSECTLHNVTQPEFLCDRRADAELEVTLSQASSAFSDVPSFTSGDNGAPTILPTSSMNVDGCVAEDSQIEDDDLYLMNCRIYLVGFDASEMRRLVSMVRGGGGSRHMYLSEKLTHIVVGAPSEMEKKEIRSLSAMGVIHAVRTIWIEDCDREKKEVPVLRRHIAYDLLLPKDLMSFNKGAVTAIPGLNQGKSPSLPDDQSQRCVNSSSQMSLEQKKQPKVTLNSTGSLKATVGSTDSNQSQYSNLISLNKPQQAVNEHQDKKSSVFRGRSFRFSNSFPDNKRAEVVDWIHEGGGEVVDDQTRKNVHFTVESHGVLCSPTRVAGGTNVSTHWIQACLRDGHLLDVSSHILFSPLQCKVPLPGFEKLKICVSHYGEKDKQLLRNLLHILGGKLVTKLNRKVDYLICKFTQGPKYVAACEWGIQTVKIEWILECAKQNNIIAPDQFLPREAAPGDLEAGAGTMSQYPTQAAQTVSEASASQLTSQSQDLDNIHSQLHNSRGGGIKNEAKHSDICKKKPRLLEDGSINSLQSYGVNQIDSVCRTISTGNKVTGNGEEVSNSVPDVAAAIEDLLEQTSKIHDQKSPERTECDKNISQVFTSDCPMLGHDLRTEGPHAAFGLSKHWIKRSNEKDDISHINNPSGEETTGIYGGFSETQTESQIVGYEEDLSGRQMIIDRARTRGSQTPNPSIT